jgi:diacylglycerol kinase
MRKPFSWRDRWRSFRPAFNGLKYALYFEHNLRLQFMLAGMVLLLSGLLGLSGPEWSLILLCTGAVFAAEIFNSAIEHLVNHVTPEIHETAGRIKDLAAAAVLVTAITAFAIACILLGPKLYQFCLHLR